MKNFLCNQDWLQSNSYHLNDKSDDIPYLSYCKQNLYEDQIEQLIDSHMECLCSSSLIY